MGAGRTGFHDSMQGGGSTVEGARAWLLGLTLKQIVVIAVIAYALITAVFVGRRFKNPEQEENVVVQHNDLVLLNKVLGEKSNVLAKEDSFSNLDSNSSDLLADEAGIEDEDLYYELRNSLYHSSVVFGLNYAEMLSKFKIFVYPTEATSFKVLSGPTDVEELDHTEDLFVYQLYHSDFVTMDPEKANLFLLPVSLRTVLEDAQIGLAKVGKFLSKYVQSVRDEYAFWSRALGADHIIISCMETREDGTRNVLELKKNAIQVACSPLAGSQAFYPHKDVAMPTYQKISRPTGNTEGERSIVAYYSGPTDPDSLYASFDVSWESDPKFAFESENVDQAEHLKMLSTSKFCLILGPQDYRNIVNALKFGCVPVVVSDGRLYDLPFQDVLNWSQFVVVVARKNVSKLAGLLADFDEQQYVAMQYLGKEASKHLEWHTHPQDQDAFHMVLYDLWIRRHAIRYVRRQEDL